MTTLEMEGTAAINGGKDAPRTARRLKLPLAPSLERRRLQSYVMLLLSDGFSIAAAFLLLDTLESGQFGRALSIQQISLILPVYWTVALSLKAYSMASLTSIRFSRSRAFASLAIAITALVLLAFFAGVADHVSRMQTAGSFVVAALLLAVTRIAVQPLIRMRCGANAENVLVFYDGGIPVRIPHAWHIETREHRLVPNSKDPHMLDRLAMFMTNMDRVLVSCPPERQMEWALVFKGSNISGEIIEQSVLSLGVLGARRGHGFGALVVSTGPLGLRSRAAKRAMDVAIAGSALMFLAPLLLVVSLLVHLHDRGPVFFKQQRQGRNNRLFWIFKFRSMRVEQLDQAGARSASKDDDRITPIGRFIRRTSIDELPQLINVLKGDMSIVGPRPHALGSLAGKKPFWEVDPRYLLRHSLKPGLTGLAQIRGFRGATDTEADLTGRLQADLEYLDGWTVWRDIRIMIATVTVLVHDRAF